MYNSSKRICYRLSPKKTQCRKSPKKTQCRKSPKRTRCRKSPKKTQCRKSPKRTRCRKSPKRTKCRSPPKRTKCRSPPKRTKCRSPPKRTRCRSPNRKQWDTSHFCMDSPSFVIKPNKRNRQITKKRSGSDRKTHTIHVNHLIPNIKQKQVKIPIDVIQHIILPMSTNGLVNWLRDHEKLDFNILSLEKNAIELLLKNEERVTEQIMFNDHEKAIPLIKEKLSSYDNWDNLTSNRNIEKILTEKQINDLPTKLSQHGWESISSNPYAINILKKYKNSEYISWKHVAENTNSINLIENKILNWDSDKNDEYYSIIDNINKNPGIGFVTFLKNNPEFIIWEDLMRNVNPEILNILKENKDTFSFLDGNRMLLKIFIKTMTYTDEDHFEDVDWAKYDLHKEYKKKNRESHVFENFIQELLDNEIISYNDLIPPHIYDGGNYDNTRSDIFSSLCHNPRTMSILEKCIILLRNISLDKSYEEVNILKETFESEYNDIIVCNPNIPKRIFTFLNIKPDPQKYVEFFDITHLQQSLSLEEIDQLYRSEFGKKMLNMFSKNNSLMKDILPKNSWHKYLGNIIKEFIVNNENLSDEFWENLSLNPHPDVIDLLEYNQDKIYWNYLWQNPGIWITEFPETEELKKTLKDIF